MILLTDHLYCVLLPHSAYFIRQFLVFTFFFSYCFGQIMCVPESYVYQIGGLCFVIRKSYVRSVSRYCFIRNYPAIPVQLEVVLHYISWCVLIVWTFVFNNNNNNNNNNNYYYYYYYYSEQQRGRLTDVFCL